MEVDRFEAEKVPLTPQNFMTAIFENSPNAIVVASLDREIISVNQAFVDQFGYSKEEAYGRQTVILYADKNVYLDQGRRSFNPTSTSNWATRQVYYKRKDGTIFPSETIGSPIKNEACRTIGYLAIIRDTTEINIDLERLENRAEKLLQESSLYQLLYRQTPAILHTIDEEGYLTNVSEKWLNTFGYKREEVVGIRRSVDFLTEKSKHYAITEALPDFRAQGSCDHVPLDFVTRDGTVREIELSAITDKSLGTSQTLAVLDDVTERNQALRELEAAYASLREFSAIISHDLHAPLRHISMFASILNEKLDKGEAVATELSMIQSSVDRMQGMIRGLLDYSSISSQKVIKQKVELRPIIDEVIAQLTADDSGTLHKPIATFDIGPLPDVTGDPDLLWHVFSNLIGNAIKYCENRPHIRIYGNEADGNVEISIEDNGIGIDPDYRDHIFLVFKRLHKNEDQYAGSGVGLSLCQRIISSHNGTIWLDPAFEGGSRFCFTLPKTAEPAIEPKVMHATASA